MPHNPPGGGGGANAFNRMNPATNAGKQTVQKTAGRAEMGIAQEALQSLRQRIQRVNIHTRMNMLAEDWNALKQKAMFGLEEMPTKVGQMPKHGHELVHVPGELLRNRMITGNMVRQMLSYTGKTLYRGIWKTSESIKRLPPAAYKSLLAIATIANIGHTMDEYWQLTLLSYIDGDQVGIGIPTNLSEFADGLNNFWWDAWPDFAFGIPVAFFAFNPPAAILAGAYFTLMEYVGKKVIGEALKDYVWPSDLKPVKELKKFTSRKLSKNRVFEGDDEDDDAGGKSNVSDRVKINQALLDSQADSNLYKYFALNSMRSIYVLAVAVQVEFFKLIDSKEADGNLSELAMKTKQKMASNEKMAKETKKFFAKNEQVQKIMKGKRNAAAASGESAKWLEEKVKEFEKDILPAMQKSEQKGDMKRVKQLKERIDEIGAGIDAQFERAMQPQLLGMAKEIAQFMVCKDDKCKFSGRSGNAEQSEWARTLARLIAYGHTDLESGAKYMTTLTVQNAYAGSDDTLQRDDQGNWWSTKNDEWLEKPKEVNGQMVLPECTPGMSQCMMDYAAGKANTSGRIVGTDGRVSHEKVAELFGGSKRWLAPFCQMRRLKGNPAPTLPMKGFWEVANASGTTKATSSAQPYQLFSVYDETQVVELNNAFKMLGNTLGVQRAFQTWKKVAKK